MVLVDYIGIFLRCNTFGHILYMYLFTQRTTIMHNKQIKGYQKMYMTDHTFIIGFCTCKSIWLLTEFYVVINKTDKTLITCLLILIFSIGNCHFNDIWHFVDWINLIGIAWFLCTLFTFKIHLWCKSIVKTLHYL
jgi:hypothetical protein